MNKPRITFISFMLILIVSSLLYADFTLDVLIKRGYTTVRDAYSEGPSGGNKWRIGGYWRRTYPGHHTSGTPISEHYTDPVIRDRTENDRSESHPKTVTYHPPEYFPATVKIEDTAGPEAIARALAEAAAALQLALERTVGTEGTLENLNRESESALEDGETLIIVNISNREGNLRDSNGKVDESNASTPGDPVNVSNGSFVTAETDVS